MLKIYLTRHGQDIDNKNGILNGHEDKSLTDVGMQQAQELAGKIKNAGLNFDYIYSSPLKRAFETAKIISNVIRGPIPLKEDLLIEREFGIISGKKKTAIESFCAPNIIKTEKITYCLSPEGAETFPELLKRAGVLLDKINKQHESGNILLVGHGDTGMMIYAKYFNLDWKDTLKKLYFGNCDLLLLSADSTAENPFVFKA